MRYSEAKQGRVFVIRLEDKEIIHETLEAFAANKGIQAALLIAMGGADTGSRLVVGPVEGEAKPVVPMEYMLKDVHEIVGTGTIFPDESGRPVLHMHIACGREGSTITGCVRSGVKTWKVAEVVLIELLDCTGVRKREEATGFKLLDP
jgi:predicted DNA-binding protein with PD1-like motif